MWVFRLPAASGRRSSAMRHGFNFHHLARDRLTFRLSQKYYSVNPASCAFSDRLLYERTLSAADHHSSSCMMMTCFTAHSAGFLFLAQTSGAPSQRLSILYWQWCWLRYRLTPRLDGPSVSPDHIICLLRARMDEKFSFLMAVPVNPLN